jgi:hypothetical protein
VRNAAAFAGGVAFAAASPSLIAAGAQGVPLPFVLAGVFGLLPDLLNLPVRARRARPDVQIYPDPLAFDADMIAGGVAQALARAARGRRPLRVRLGDARIDAERYVCYAVAFDTRGRCVRVEGDIRAQCALPAAVRLPDGPRIAVGSGGARDFVLAPEEGGVVTVRAVPRPGPWSHSLGLGLLAAAGAGWAAGIPTGFACAGAWMLHLALDGLITPAALTLRCIGARGLRLVRGGGQAVPAAATASALLWILLALWRTVPGAWAPNPLQAATACLAVPPAAFMLYSAFFACRQPQDRVKLTLSRAGHRLRRTHNRRALL